jgi:hypothetical protein
MFETTTQSASEAQATSTAELLPIAKASLIEACCPECAGDEPCC